jgi:hypothetical protein
MYMLKKALSLSLYLDVYAKENLWIDTVCMYEYVCVCVCVCVFVFVCV